MDITATFQWTQREARRMARNAPRVRRAYFVFPVLGLLGLLGFMTDGSTTYMLAMLVIVGFGVPVAMEAKLRGSTKRGDPLLASTWSVRITDSCYSLHTAISHVEVDWNAYSKVISRAGFWYLHRDNRVVGFLPQRAFDPAQHAQLATFFATRLPPRKRR